MLDETRRGILKLFGVTAGAAAAATIPTPAVDAVLSQRIKVSPLEMVFVPPPGVTYNWKRVFIDRETPDFAYVMKLVAAGWKPVPWHRHSDLLGSNHGSYWIEHGGLVLMQKPTKDTSQPVAHPTMFDAKPTQEYEFVHQLNLYGPKAS